MKNHYTFNKHIRTKIFICKWKNIQQFKFRQKFIGGFNIKISNNKLILMSETDIVEEIKESMRKFFKKYNLEELKEGNNCCSYSYELVRTFFFKNKRIFNS